MAEATTRVRGIARGLPNSDIDAQIPAARAREASAFAAGLRATSVRYDGKTERIVLELSNGVAFAFPVKHVRGLKNASRAQRAACALSPSGSGVIWDALDADISVPGLLARNFRRAGLAALLGSAGGSRKSPAKARAARANGAKGGRPRTSRSSRKSRDPA